MSKQSIFTRVSQLAKANINALLDKAEDPEKILDQMIRDYKNNIVEAQGAVAQTIGNLRLIEQDYTTGQRDVSDWGNKAIAASRKADEFRTAGNTIDAGKFDDLAKVALTKQINAENQAKSLEPTILQQRQVVEKLKTGLQLMKDKLGELTSKRDELVARSRIATAQSQVHEAVQNLDVLDPTSELSRFEQKIRSQEAQVAGQEEIASSSLDAQFASLEDLTKQTEVEARLAALKGAQPAPSALPASSEEAPKAVTAGDETAEAETTADSTEQHTATSPEQNTPAADAVDDEKIEQIDLTFDDEPTEPYIPGKI